jgi:hypothetical protein
MAKDPLKKARRLRKTDETWQGTARLARTWITPRNQAPYRPYIIAVIEQDGDRIIRTKLFDTQPTPERVFEALIKAMTRPTLGAGRPRRPARLLLDDAELVEALAPHLAELEIRCEYRHTLPLMNNAMLEMEAYMNKREPIPGLLKIPGVTPHLVSGLYKAAAFYYRQAPWRWISDAFPIEVRYPPTGKPRHAVVMGHGGETYGLSVYNSTDDLRLLYSGIAPEKTIGQISWMTVVFEEALAASFDDLDNIVKYGWPVVNDSAYPIPIKVTRTGDYTIPSKSELLWFEAAMLAIPTFVRDYMQADRGLPHPAEATLTVAVADGETDIYLRYPAPGFGPSPEPYENAKINNAQPKSYPIPRERQRIIERREKLREEIIYVLVRSDPQADQDIARLAQVYGADDVELILRTISERASQSAVVGEEPALYRKYRVAFARFGGTRRLLGKQEFEELAFEATKMVAKDFLKPEIFRKPSRRQRELEDLLLTGVEIWEDITPEDPPPRPSTFVSPPAGQYSPPLNGLLNLGWQADEQAVSAFARLASLQASHVPDLLRMVLDEELRGGWPADAPTWAPLHALRLLGQLRARQTAAPLLALMEDENDWLSDLLPSVWAAMGPKAASPLWDYLEQRVAPPQWRGNVIIGLAHMGQEHKAYRREVIDGFIKLLEESPPGDEEANGYVVHALASLLKVRRAWPAIRRAYDSNKLDDSIMTLDDVRRNLGPESPPRPTSHSRKKRKKRRKR